MKRFITLNSYLLCSIITLKFCWIRLILLHQCEFCNKVAKFPRRQQPTTTTSKLLLLRMYFSINIHLFSCLHAASCKTTLLTRAVGSVIFSPRKSLPKEFNSADTVFLLTSYTEIQYLAL